MPFTDASKSALSAVCILECLGVILFLPLALPILVLLVEGKPKGKPKYKSHIVLEFKSKRTHTRHWVFFCYSSVKLTIARTS